MSDMTTKDRILCALGFHGKLIDTDKMIVKRPYGLPLTGTPINIGVIKTCSICNRDVRCK